MEWKNEWKALLVIVTLFLISFYLPVGQPRFDQAMFEALHLLKSYAREHVLLCLVPAFFIAGAIGVFISQASVMKYLGAGANKILAYGVASVSGSILAVCSCTVLPLFAGIYRMGAGLGPATAFLYSGPAINVLAIIMTARILGLSLGIARGVGAVVFSIVIGLLMHLIFRDEEAAKAQAQMVMPEHRETRPLAHTALFFATMVAILVFANWGKPEAQTGAWHLIFAWKWVITGAFGVALALIVTRWFKVAAWKISIVAAVTVFAALFAREHPEIPFTVAVFGFSTIISMDEGESGEWFAASWGFAKQILPLLLAGILISGALLGRPGHEALIPSRWISGFVGGNSIWANLFASVVGAFMYFATLTEVPILQGLLGSGMGQGPALALLLAGPALSLPSMLVLRSVMGTKKTVVYVILVVVMATISGMLYGAIA